MNILNFAIPNLATFLLYLEKLNVFKEKNNMKRIKWWSKLQMYVHNFILLMIQISKVFKIKLKNKLDK